MREPSGAQPEAGLERQSVFQAGRIDAQGDTALGIEGIEKLPAIQWKLANIRKISAKKRAELLDKLKRTLGW